MNDRSNERSYKSTVKLSSSFIILKQNMREFKPNMKQ